MSEDIAKAWAGIGSIKASVSGLERKITTYRNSQRNPEQYVPRSVFDNTDHNNSRNLTADTVPRTVVECRGGLNYNQRTSSPLKSGRNDVVFSDIESVSTIPSRPLRDPKSIEEGMLKLKEKILRQKQLSGQLTKRSTTEKTGEQQVRFLDPEEYAISTSPHTRAPQIASRNIVRKRKKVTAPTLEHNPGCNEAQKPIKKPIQLAPQPRRKSPDPKPTMQPVQRKVKSGDGSKNAIITTSSWRQGAALTRKVLGNKTQETTSSTSITSDTTSAKTNDVSKNEVQPQKTNKIKKPKTPTKLPKKPKKIEKPPVEEPPKVKARHYNPTDVQQYIENTRKQRKEQMMAERKKQIGAEKEKEKRLKELDEFRKKALKRSTANTSPTSPAPQPWKKISTDSSSKQRASSNESSDKENTLSEKSVPSIPLIPQSHTESAPETQSPPTHEIEVNLSDNDTTLVEDDEKDISVKEVNLLDTYMDPGKQDSFSSTTALYNEQRQRMDTIRQTALALRQKIYEETNRLTAEASRATNFTAGLQPGYSQQPLPGTKNIREAWPATSDNSTTQDQTDNSLSDVSKASSVDYRAYQIRTPPKREVTPEPYQFPLTADPYSIINIYARKREIEQKRIGEVRKEREVAEERERAEREGAVLRERVEREEEQDTLRELERQLLEDKEAIAVLEEHRRSRSRSHHTTSVLQSDLSITSDVDVDTRNTESLLRTSSSDGSTRDSYSSARDSYSSTRDSYHFTPDKTEDLSLVSPASTRKALSFSEEDTPAKAQPLAADESALYSPGALHRKLRGELARYDTFSAGLEHVNTLEHTQQYTEAQHDTIAMARAMKREKTEHVTEMSELQEKLKKDMLAFQEKLQKVQQQTMLNKAESLAKEAEIKAKSAEAALQATHQIAQSQEATSKELINMAQHILKSHTKKKSESTPTTSQSVELGSETPYTPSLATPQLSKSTVDDINDVTVTGSEPPSPVDSTLNYTELDTELHSPSPTKSQVVESEIPEDISEEPTSPQHDILTELSGDPVTPVTEPVTPVTEPVTPTTDRREVVDDTQAREADVETEFEMSPETAHESFRAVLPSESHRRRMSASDQESVVSVNVSTRKDTFTTFTLEQVSQYMKNEKIRSRHQKALLDLREEALKNKTDAKLQWIDIKKKRFQRRGYDEKMPPLIQQEKHILAKLASEQEEIRRLATVQRAAQAERKKMLLQQREITMIQERAAALRRKIKYAEEHPTDFEDGVSDTDASEYTRMYSEYDTDASSMYEADDHKIRSLTAFNDKIQKEGQEVRKLLDLVLFEKRETEKIEQEFGISSPSRLPRGITPLNETSSTLKDSMNDTLKYSEVEFSTPVREGPGSAPDSPALSVIEPDQSSFELKEMEDRIQKLKEELKKKKEEARRLLKDQQLKKKEALRQQELKLRKQIQTVTDVIEKQKKQITTKLRQHSPIRSEKDSPTKRSLIRSHSSRSDVSLSSDSSRIISVTSSLSDKDVTVSERQDGGSISESIDQSSRSVSVSLEKQSNRAPPTHGSSVSSWKRDDSTSHSISENLNEFSEPSYQKVHLSFPEILTEKSAEPTKPSSFSENIQSIQDLVDGDQRSSEKPSIYSLQEVGDIVDEDRAPYESPQPSFHLDVKEVLEDLSISSGSSINDATDVSISSYKNLPPPTKPTEVKVLSEAKDDSISEEISEALTSENFSDPSKSLPKKSDLAASSKSEPSSHTKTISEKLAELNLDGGIMSPTLNKLTARSSAKHSYTLSFDEAEDDDDDIKSLLSNIDESLNKSADILSAAKCSSPGLVNLELDVDALTPAAAARHDQLVSIDPNSTKAPTLGGEIMKTRSVSGESEKSRDSEKSRGMFSNLTDISSPTPGSSTDTRSTTKRLDQPSHSPVPLLPSPPKELQSPVNKLLSERSQSLRQTSFKPPSIPVTNEIEEELSVTDETDIDIDDFSHDGRSETNSRQELSQSRHDSESEGSELSDSKTMSELKELMSEPSKRFKSSSGSTTPVQEDILSPKTVISDEDEKTISEKSDSPREQDVTTPPDITTPRDVTETTRDVTETMRDPSEQLPSELVQEMLRAALQKMLKVRQTKIQRELSSSPKYTERSPTSPEHPSPVRGEPAIFNDTYRDTDLENALNLARSCTTAEERPTVTTPEVLPPPKVTVQNTAEASRKLAAAATRHLVSCIRDRRPRSLGTLSLETDYPADFSAEEREQSRVYSELVMDTTLECFHSIDLEYNLSNREKEQLPPWKAAIKRQPRPHWMKGLPSRVTLLNVGQLLPDLVVRILGLSEDSKPRRYHNMETILAQEIRDEEAEWTDYDSDELVVKFRIADSIFENLLRETMAVFSAIEAKF